MKYFLYFVVFVLLISSIAMAETCEDSSEVNTKEEQMEIKTDVPNFLKGATIIVRLANGKETVVPAEKFKVVPRKQQFLTVKTDTLKTRTCTQVISENKKNRFSVMAGKGPKPGLDRRNYGNVVEVESRTGTVGGAQYQRMLNTEISVGAQLQTNETVLLNIGIDF